MSATVLAGTNRDIDEVMTIMADAFDPAYGEAWTRSQCLAILDLPGVSLLLAQQDGEPAGFALGRTIIDESELLLLAVRSAYRRKGIGRRLLMAVIEDAAKSRSGRLFLEMRADNPALALYLDHGFAPIGRRSAYYRGLDGMTRDALTLLRPIAG